MTNLYSLDTREKLDAYGSKVLLVTEDIDVSSVTGKNRAVALFHFNANFQQESITLVVGVYELDAQGEPIISQSLKPYEESIVATNGKQVDMQTPGLEIILEEDKVEGGIYMGEYDAYIYITKNNPIELWTLFESIIKRSSKINSPTI
jgi:hypothetical protein